MIHYFAYGSNLHPLRISERVRSAKLVGAVKVPDYRLEFHKRSNKDGSGKCNMQSASSIDFIHGAIYTLSPKDKTALDKIEGVGSGYECHSIDIQHQDQTYTCATYLAQKSHIKDNLAPYHWYKKMVILGAEYLNFPATYIATIKAIQSKPDPNEARRSKNETLLKAMTEANRNNQPNN